MEYYRMEDSEGHSGQKSRKIREKVCQKRKTNQCPNPYKCLYEQNQKKEHGFEVTRKSRDVEVTQVHSVGL